MHASRVRVGPEVSRGRALQVILMVDLQGVGLFFSASDMTCVQAECGWGLR